MTKPVTIPTADELAPVVSAFLSRVQPSEDIVCCVLTVCASGRFTITRQVAKNYRASAITGARFGSPVGNVVRRLLDDVKFSD